MGVRLLGWNRVKEGKGRKLELISREGKGRKRKGKKWKGKIELGRRGEESLSVVCKEVKVKKRKSDGGITPVRKGKKKEEGEGITSRCGGEGKPEK